MALYECVLCGENYVINLGRMYPWKLCKDMEFPLNSSLLVMSLGCALASNHPVDNI